MMPNSCLRTLSVAALALWGISCSASTPSGGKGGSGSATGGASGGTSATGGAGGAGGGTSSGTGGNSTGGKAGSSAGGSANSGSSGGGNGGSGSGGAVTGGAASGGAAGNGGSAGNGGASNGSGGSTAGTSGAGSGGTGRDGAAGNVGSGGSTTSGTDGGAAGRGGAGSSGSATGGSGSGGTTGAGGTTGGGTAVPSVGCGKTSTITFGTVPGESGTAVGFGTGGYVKIGSRGFAMRLPDNYDKNKPYWLIFGFHWNGGNSKEVDTGGSNGYSMAHFGLQKLSNNGAIFVAPDGLNAGWGGDNLPFVDDMVKLIQDNYCVDTTHLFTNGFSYGGGMSYAIACARAKVFRGAAIYEGAVLSGCEGGTDPIALWQMAGTTDTTCTISMATPMRDKFVKNNGCTGPTTEPPRPTSISQAHICTDYTGCKTGYPLRWCVHPAGHGNAIVDGTADLWNSCATPPKTCSDSCKCTWVPDDVWSWMTKNF